MTTDHPPVEAAGAPGATVDEWPNPVAGVHDAIAPLPGVPKPDPILLADDVSRAFGGLKAVDVEHLEVQRGAITALIGPNGAGKTSLFNLLTGFDKADSGRVTFDGRVISGISPHRLAKAGMVRTFQLTKVLSRLSVLENMKLGPPGQVGERFWSSLIAPLWRKQDASIEAKADDLLARFNLAHMRDEYAGTLSGGQRKLLEMARCLMTAPTLVMLDEPMAGVNPALTQSLLGHIKSLRSEGITVLFIEHNMDVVRDISDWVVVMAEGAIIAEGKPDEIGRNQLVIDAYIGAEHDMPISERSIDPIERGSSRE